MSKLAIVLGVVFIALAVVYLAIPANSLPSFVPGFDPDLDQVHYKHGLGALVVGLAFFAYAWASGGGERDTDDQSMTSLQAPPCIQLGGVREEM